MLLAVQSRTSAVFSAKAIAVLAAVFGTLAWLLMTWRWGGTVEDSLAYFNTARYLRGEIPASELRAPFPYRLLVPAVAAALPGNLRDTFAALNWALVTTAALLVSQTALRIGFDRRRAVVAGLLMLVSVPTFWYAPYLLVDPGSICARSLFVLGVLTGQPWLAAAAGIVATAVREENILLLAWLLLARRIGFATGLAALAAAGGWLLAVRWWLIPGLPSYTWRPNWWTVQHALQDVPSILSLAGCAGVVLPLALAGFRRSPASVRPLKSLLLLMTLPLVYAAMSVRIDGRAIWGLYPFLIPFAMAAFPSPRWDLSAAAGQDGKR
jgi:hypothetical protein